MNEQAFPGFDYISQDGKKNPTGMTLRDYFAAKAMIPCYQEWLKNGWNVPEHEEVMENIANESYLIADAMLKARQK